MEPKYKTFKRSATNFKTMAAAKCITVDRGLTIEEARRACLWFNSNRTPTQVRKGTKLEFTAE